MRIVSRQEKLHYGGTWIYLLLNIVQGVAIHVDH